MGLTFDFLPPGFSTPDFQAPSTQQALNDSRRYVASYPGPEEGPGITVCACADTPLFCGASETTVIWPVFHDRTLLKHAGRYILVENDGGQFRENCIWTSRVVRP